MSQSTGDDIDSAGVNPQAEVFPPDEGMTWFSDNDRVVIQPEITDDGSRSRRSSRRLKELTPAAPDREAKTGMPNIDEWMHFFCNSVIKVATDFYIDMAFRGIDEEWLTEREIQRIKLSEDERRRMGRPLAEFAYKNKFTRKHGRSIIAAADSIDSVIQFGMWFSRVNRIAAKYKRMMNGQQPEHYHFDAPRTAPPPPPDQNERGDDGRTRPGEPNKENGHNRNWRPSIGGTVLRNFDG